MHSGLTEHVPIRIVQADIEDVRVLQELSRRTFIETYEAYNTAENMTFYLENDLSERQLKEELLDADSEFYLLYSGDNAAGFLKLCLHNTNEMTARSNGLEIARIYVLKAFHGLSLGRKLFEKSVERAHSASCDYIWLGVWEKNEQARSFYSHLGFKVIGNHFFQLGKDLQNDLILAKEL